MYNHVDNVDKCKKEEKTQAEDVEQFVYNFWDKYTGNWKSDSEFGSKKRDRRI